MPEAGSWQSLIAPIVFMVGLVVMFYFIVIRPTQVRAKKHKALIGAVAPGDRIVTVGGIYGKVMSVEGDTIGVEIARGITIKMDRRAVRRHQDKEDL